MTTVRSIRAILIDPPSQQINWCWVGDSWESFAGLLFGEHSGKLLQPVRLGADVTLYVDEEGHCYPPTDPDALDRYYFGPDPERDLSVYAGRGLLVRERVDGEGDAHYGNMPDEFLPITRRLFTFLTHEDAFQRAKAYDREAMLAAAAAPYPVHHMKLASMMPAPEEEQTS